MLKAIRSASSAGTFYEHFLEAATDLLILQLCIGVRLNFAVRAGPAVLFYCWSGWNRFHDVRLQAGLAPLAVVLYKG